MSALILFRTLLYAQRGAHLLAKNGIPGTVVKAPRLAEDRGCTYAIRLSERRRSRALEILKKQGMDYGRVFLVRPDGTLEEVGS